MKRITDKEFRYYSSADTDLKRTFRRIRREQAQAAAEVKVKVTALPKAKAK